MKDISISLMEINDLQESARVLSVAMLDNPLHVTVFKGKGERERMQIEDMFGELLIELPGIVFLAKEKEKEITIPKPEVIRRSRWERRCPIRFTFDSEHGYVSVKCYLKKMYSALPRYKGHRYKKNNILTLAINPKTGLFENINMNKIGTGDMFKA